MASEHFSLAYFDNSSGDKLEERREKKCEITKIAVQTLTLASCEAEVRVVIELCLNNQNEWIVKERTVIHKSKTSFCISSASKTSLNVTSLDMRCATRRGACCGFIVEIHQIKMKLIIHIAMEAAGLKNLFITLALNLVSCWMLMESALHSWKVIKWLGIIGNEAVITETTSETPNDSFGKKSSGKLVGEISFDDLQTRIKQFLCTFSRSHWSASYQSVSA